MVSVLQLAAVLAAAFSTVTAMPQPFVPRPGSFPTSDGSSAYPDGATRLHINKGCIVVNGKELCFPKQEVIKGTTATVHAAFPGDSTEHALGPNEHCTLHMTWPDNYGDIYFGEDNCLYDSDAKLIEGQCCRGAGEGWVNNPYV